MTVSREDVLAALAAVPMPGTGGSLVDADAVRALTVEGGRVRFLLEVDPGQGPALEPTRAAAEAAVAALPGVAAVSVLLTAHGPAPKPAPPPDLKIGRHPTPQAGPAIVPGVQPDHRGRQRQGRRRQVDARRQPRGGARPRGQARRPARRRHLRPLAAADDGGERAAEVARRQDHPAAHRPRRHHDVDRADAEGGRGGDLARPDAAWARCSSSWARSPGASSTC